MSRRHALATALAACHLVLAVLGAAHLAPWLGASWAVGPIRTYAALSGVDGEFGFFAPGVSPQVRATFTLTDRAGRSWTDTLDRGANREVQLRIGTIVSAFPIDGPSSEWRRDATASWAATMFGRHPAAERVAVRVEVWDIPPMTAYRAGERPRWQMAYEATYSRQSGQYHPEER